MVVGSNHVAVYSDMVPASSKKFLDIQANYRVCIHYETCMWQDNKIQTDELFFYCKNSGDSSFN